MRREELNTPRLKLPMSDDTRQICGFPVQSLSIMQEWLLHTALVNAGALIHTTVAIELLGRLCHRSLRAALDQMVARHEVLRTAFGSLQGHEAMRIGTADRGFSCIEQDIFDEAELLRFIQIETQTPFDVANGPLVRARVLQLMDNHHYLLVSAHPLVCDRPSLHTLIGEIGTLYGHFCGEKGTALPPIVQCSQAARSERAEGTPEELHRQLNFWKRYLLGARGSLDLPSDRPRSPQQTYSIKKHELKLGRGISDGLRGLAANSGSSLLAVLLSGWAVLLHRWSGQHDLTIGVPTARRALSRDGSLIGAFENTLAIRISVFPSTTASSLISRIELSLLAAREHQDVSFGCVVESLRHFLGDHQLLRSSLSLGETSLSTQAATAFSCGSLRVGSTLEEMPGTHVEMSLDLAQGHSGLTGCIAYAAEIFEDSTIQRAATWLESLLESMTMAPDCRVAHLTMLPLTERMLILREFHTETSMERSNCIHNLLENYAAQTPDAPAVTDLHRTLTYAELNYRSNRLARTLRARGLQLGDLVAIQLDPSCEMIISLVATLKAGGAYIISEPNESPDGMKRHLGLHLPRIAIVARGSQVRASLDGAFVVALDAAPSDNDQQENLALEEIEPKALACVRRDIDHVDHRRWVLVEHRNITSVLASLDEILHFNQHDIWSLLHSPSSVIGQLELWSALLFGGQLAVLPKDARTHPSCLARSLSKARVTILHLTDRELSKLTRADIARSPLHTVIAGGCPAQPASMNGAQPAGSHWPQLIRLYGNTATLAGAFARIGQGYSATGRVRIRPLSSVDAYILDRHGQPAPIGIVGDIHLTGDGVSRSYFFNGKEREFTLSRSSFDDNVTLYKTGNRGLWTPEGAIELI